MHLGETVVYGVPRLLHSAVSTAKDSYPPMSSHLYCTAFTDARTEPASEQLPAAMRTRKLYHPKDVQRIRENDDLCRRYVRHKELDIPAALTWAKNSLRWRKQSGINDATEECFPMEFFHAGTLVPYNTDKFGSHVLTLRVKNHRKDSSVVDEMRKYFAFFMDKIIFEKDSLRVTVVFDCTDAGVSNVDMELVKFVVTVFKELYPWALGYIIVHNMPWILNAVWKIVKAMLPSEGVQRVIFSSKDSLLQYIDRRNLPKYMGGEDNYVYQYQKGNPLGDRCPRCPHPKVAIP
ncbi:hypothetical protein HPB50_007344 [Hyalomma asiaticum]|uniref:Uncharacterized protein n=1 Tax=Hyalomma asiaticum TaxID=266040 RepID=A0ACB7SVW3_HYAAI|nr:hypothetical protein HPB50_007344 [Hyalomma asiaticum]